MKNQIINILKTNFNYNSAETTPEEIQADQILDLILNKIVIEKKELRLAKTELGRQWMRGWNECVNKLEEIKSKLRE